MCSTRTVCIAFTIEINFIFAFDAPQTKYKIDWMCSLPTANIQVHKSILGAFESIGSISSSCHESNESNQFFQIRILFDPVCDLPFYFSFHFWQKVEWIVTLLAQRDRIEFSYRDKKREKKNYFVRPDLRSQIKQVVNGDRVRVAAGSCDTFCISFSNFSVSISMCIRMSGNCRCHLDCGQKFRASHAARTNQRGNCSSVMHTHNGDS